MTRDTCGGCGQSELVPTLDFGDAPIADRLVAMDSLPSEDPRAPLALTSCTHCGLVQLDQVVDPRKLFDDQYPYLSSVSSTLRAESEILANRLIRQCSLDGGSKVLEVASNDGYLLRYFHEAGIKVLGVDPAKPAVEAAQACGIRTLHSFFDLALAEKLAEQGEVADLVIANNILAHVPDVNGFLAGLALVTKPSGRIVLQVQWLHDLVAGNAFDTIYHQHVYYFSLTSLLPLVTRHGFTIVEVERVAAQGGSLLIEIARDGEPNASVHEILEIERQSGLGCPASLGQFADRVKETCARIGELVREFKSNGGVVAAYGAAAKGTTLLHLCNLDSEDVSYVVDRNPQKQGRYMPGSRIPIVGPDKIRNEAPSAILLLAWNLADEILCQEAEYIQGGGHFIIPLPEPRVIQ